MELAGQVIAGRTQRRFSGLLAHVAMAGLLVSACTERPPSVATSESAPAPEPAPSPAAEPDDVEYFVFFGSFDDSLSAFQYTLSLALDGAEARQAASGHYWVVTGPTERAAADELAEKHGGRVLTGRTLETMMERR